jgi:hypothetical protein
MAAFCGMHVATNVKSYFRKLASFDNNKAQIVKKKQIFTQYGG